MRSLGRILICLLLPLRVSASEPPTPAYGENPVTGAYAELNGIKLYYEQYGTGEPAVLVIHGNGASLAQMEFQITHFARTHRVIAADSRGFRARTRTSLPTWSTVSFNASKPRSASASSSVAKSTRMSTRSSLVVDSSTTTPPP